MDYEEDIDPAEASLAISNVLHNVGYSAPVRRVCRYICLFDNLSATTSGQLDIRIIGSVGEGLASFALLHGTQCDIDQMLIPSECEAYDNADVLDSLQHWQFQMEPCENNSGYVKLKVIKEGKEIPFCMTTPFSDFIENDAKSNIRYLQNAIPVCLIDKFEEQPILKECLECIVTGPSCSRVVKDTRISILSKIDQVISIPCPTWPSVAAEWVKRKRDYGWPSKRFILEHEQQGCYVVPVGCKVCERCDLDWRLSFVLVEKALIWDFNITQVHCLLLLKQLKTHVFEKQIGDIISSYILKVVVFWMIEESPPDLWVPHRLLTTVQMCLDRLISFVQNDFCPSYFIRTCNLLAARYTRSEKKSVIQTCLRARQNTRVLLCQTPPFNEAFSSQRMEQLALQNVKRDLQERELQNMCYLDISSGILIRCALSSQQTLSTAIRYCKRKFVQLREMLPIDDIKQHAAIKKKQVGLMYIRFVWTNFYLRAHNNKRRYRCIRMLRYEITEIDDLVEAVTFCHLNTAVGNYTISNEALKMFISKFKVLPYIRTQNLVDLFAGLTCNESYSHMQPITDIIFLRFEIDLLPPPIQMEMCPIKDHGEHFDFSSVMPNTVAVDPLVYACFLRFWCCVKLDQNIEKLKARDDMVWCCGLPDITNKAVAYNLLGFCHKHLDEYDEALRAFRTAWKQEPRSNATLLHICVLVYSTFRRELNETSPD